MRCTNYRELAQTIFTYREVAENMLRFGLDVNFMSEVASINFFFRKIRTACKPGLDFFAKITLGIFFNWGNLPFAA